jgi:hypothetical protein
MIFLLLATLNKYLLLPPCGFEPLIFRVGNAVPPPMGRAFCKFVIMLQF